jgi:hypothetical protein
MLARLNDRLKHLEAKLVPKGLHFVFVHFDDGDPGTLSKNERLAAFKAEHSTASPPSDISHEVSINFA